MESRAQFTLFVMPLEVEEEEEEEVVIVVLRLLNIICTH